MQRLDGATEWPVGTQINYYSFIVEPRKPSVIYDSQPARERKKELCELCIEKFIFCEVNYILLGFIYCGVIWHLGFQITGLGYELLTSWIPIRCSTKQPLAISARLLVAFVVTFLVLEDFWEWSFVMFFEDCGKRKTGPEPMTLPLQEFHEMFS